MWDSLILLDRQLFLVLNASFNNPYLDAFFLCITDARFWIAPAAGGAVWFVYREQRKALAVMALSLVTVAIADPLASQLIKPFFGRLRPCNPEALIEGGRFLLGYKRSFSFPSNHATNIFGAATVLSLFYPRQTGFFALFAVLIGYSRIHTGVHFPADVGGGAFLGMITGIVVFSSYRGVLVLVAGRKRAEQGDRDTRDPEQMPDDGSGGDVVAQETQGGDGRSTL